MPNPILTEAIDRLCRGEALTAAHVTAVRAHGAHLRIFNEYGPTETTVGATGAFVDPDDVSIGGPYAHMQACGLVNDHLVDCWRYKKVISHPGRLKR